MQQSNVNTLFKLNCDINFNKIGVLCVRLNFAGYVYRISVSFPTHISTLMIRTVDVIPNCLRDVVEINLMHFEILINYVVNYNINVNLYCKIKLN